MAERFSVRGILRTRELPDPTWDEATFNYWWCDEKNSSGIVVRRARMSPKEKDRYTVAEGENLITTNGINNILTFLGLGSGTATLFSKWFAVGTGAIASVSKADTTIATELYRLQATGTAITGNQQDVSILFTSTNGNGTWSNAGWWGGAATSTANSGTLETHVLYSYTKTTGSITNDYLYILSFS